MAGLHGRFPHLSFLLLAVAHDAVDLVLLVIESCCECHAYCNAQTLAQRSRRHFHTRQFQLMRMALIGRAQLA